MTNALNCRIITTSCVCKTCFFNEWELFKINDKSSKSTISNDDSAWSNELSDSNQDSPLPDEGCSEIEEILDEFTLNDDLGNADLEKMADPVVITKPKKKILKWTLISSGSVLSLVIIGILIYAGIILDGLNYDRDFPKDDSNLGITTPTDDEPKDITTITNIALFGTDQRHNEDSRSDTIMILTLDGKHKKIKLTSIMRDSYVHIDGYGMDKINHAYFFGGPTLAVRTINENFGLDIRNYATVNFSQLMEIVDAIGGVDIEIKDYELRNINSQIEYQSRIYGKPATYLASPGMQRLNGIQALGYSRVRYVGNGDFERTQRQRDLLDALFHEALNLKKIDYPEVARKIFPYVQTSMTIEDGLKFGGAFLNNSINVEQARLPADSGPAAAEGQLINGVSYLVYDLEAAKDAVRAFIYDDIPIDEVPTDDTHDDDNLSSDVTAE